MTRKGTWGVRGRLTQLGKKFTRYGKLLSKRCLNVGDILTFYYLLKLFFHEKSNIQKTVTRQGKDCPLN